MGAVSFNPTEHVAGGMLDDVDVQIVGAKIAAWDYNGQAARGSEVCAIAVTFRGLNDVNDPSADQTQYYSIGELTKFTPSPDGRQAIPTGSASAINKNSNGHLFLMSLLNAGVQQDRFSDDISLLRGINCHVNQMPAPKRDFKPRPGRTASTQKENATILLVTKLVEGPEPSTVAANTAPRGPKAATPPAQTSGPVSTASSPSAPAPVGKPAPTTAPAAASAISDEALGIIITVLGEKKAPIAKTLLATEAFRRASAANRNAIVGLFGDEAWLTSQAAFFGYDSASATISPLG